MASVDVTPNDRLSFTLFMAVALHVAMVLGLGFSWQIQQPSSPTIEVTLSQYDDGLAPKDADFIAATNQLGSGDASEALEQTTMEEADFEANVTDEIASDVMLVLPDDADLETLALLTTESASDDTVARETRDPAEAVDSLNSRTLEELVKEIASLEAQIADKPQINARGERVRRLNSMSTRRTADAWYLQSWRRKVEAVGNLNYPEEARTRQLFGDLSLLVTIEATGNLREVRLLRSSGHKVLDDAAMRIVRLAAPYPPFPAEMRKNTDLLEIVRSWQFRRAS